MIRGNVAVVRHGATAPSTQSGAVLLELSPSRMRDSGWDQLPPDVRFAGEALQKMRAPPWIAIYLNQPLTERTHDRTRPMLHQRRPHMTQTDMDPLKFCSTAVSGQVCYPFSRQHASHYAARAQQRSIRGKKARG